MEEISIEWETNPGEKAFNYDAILVRPHFSKYPYFIMADGVGTKKASKAMAEFAINKISDDLRENASKINSTENLKALMKKAIKDSNEWILKRNKKEKESNPRAEEGQATIDVGVFYKKKILLAHAGDGRVYFLKKNNSIFQTKDETEAFDLLINRGITRDELKVHPANKGVTNALGAAEIKINMYECDINKVKAVFAATDGLYERLTDKEIKTVLSENSTAKEKLGKIFTIANNPEGIKKIIEKNPEYQLSYDNMTGLVVIIKDSLNGGK